MTGAYYAARIQRELSGRDYTVNLQDFCLENAHSRGRVDKKMGVSSIY